MNKYVEMDNKSIPEDSAITNDQQDGTVSKNTSEVEPDAENAEENIESNQNDSITETKLETLYDYIAGLYNGVKPTKAYRRHFVSLKEYSLKIVEKEDLLSLSQAKDKHYKTLLVLADILMEQETQPHGEDQANPRGDAMITYIEYVVSHVGNLAKLSNTTIFQEWIDKAEGSGKYSFLCGKIAEIKHGLDKDNKPKVIPEGQQSSLKCIAAAWLFYKKHASFEDLLRELSLGSFSVDNSSSVYAEKRSVGFLTKMIGSPNREGFAYLLNHLKNKNQEVINDKNNRILENGRLSRENEALRHRVSELESRLAEITLELEAVNATSSQLAHDLKKTEIQAGHHSIHQKDELKGVKGRIINFLENDVLIELNSASVANSREPPKSKVVERKLTNVIEFIGDQLKWLKK